MELITLHIYLVSHYIVPMLYIMSRVDGLSFRSKPDLLQRHKQTSTNKYIFIYRKEEGKGIKGRIQKKNQENYSQSKFLFEKQLVAMNQCCIDILYLLLYLYWYFAWTAPWASCLADLSALDKATIIVIIINIPYDGSSCNPLINNFVILFDFVTAAIAKGAVSVDILCFNACSRDDQCGVEKKK